MTRQLIATILALIAGRFALWSMAVGKPREAADALDDAR